MDLITITYILSIHFIADFVLQSDRVAKGKSKDSWVLLEHGTIYMIPLLLISPMYALVNASIHITIDYFTSRLSGKLWARGEVHNFFVVIGFDQLLHVLTLLWTYKLIMGN